MPVWAPAGGVIAAASRLSTILQRVLHLRHLVATGRKRVGFVWLQVQRELGQLAITGSSKLPGMFFCEGRQVLATKKVHNSSLSTSCSGGRHVLQNQTELACNAAQGWLGCRCGDRRVSRHSSVCTVVRNCRQSHVMQGGPGRLVSLPTSFVQGRHSIGRLCRIDQCKISRNALGANSKKQN